MNYQLKDINPLLLILIVVIIWNFIKYENQHLLFISLIIGILYYYENKVNNTKRKEDVFKLKSDKVLDIDVQKIKIITDKFVKKYGGLTTNFNNIDLKKMPTKYVFIFRNKELFVNLLNLRFIGKLHEIGYAHIFGILEVFLKNYYKVISKSGPLQIIENLKELHLLFHNLHQELLYNTPVSYIQNEMTLHDLINSNMKIISIFMMRKIRIVKALIDDKIK